MNRPTWEEFSSLFENPKQTKVRKVQATLIARHPSILSGYGPEDDYLDVFSRVFDIALDWKEGMGVFLEYLAEYLGPDVLAVEFDDDYEVATVRFAGRDHLFNCSELGSEMFDADLERLQTLMRSRYVFRLFFQGAIDDTLRFLVIPASLWERAEKDYGMQRTSACLIPYGSLVSLNGYDATRRWNGPYSKLKLFQFAIPVLIVLGAGVVSFYNPPSANRASELPTCESMQKVFGKLSKSQSEALIDDMRRKNTCKP